MTIDLNYMSVKGLGENDKELKLVRGKPTQRSRNINSLKSSASDFEIIARHTPKRIAEYA